MKSFSQFVKEATSASTYAKKLALAPDGHGGYYNRATGEFEAKSIGGKLKFFNKRQVFGKKDPKQSEHEKNIPLGYSMKTEEYDDQNNIEELNEIKTLVVLFGRFNPPTAGHLQAMDIAAEESLANENSDYIIVPSRRFDKKQNPLDPDTKISFMRRIFPEHSERIINDKNLESIFDVLKKAYVDGYSDIKIICGSNRINEFKKLAESQNGILYNFNSIEVFPSGDIDPDGKNNESISSSRLRLAAYENDLKSFKIGLPDSISNKDAKDLFYLTRIGMGIDEFQESKLNSWEIFPKLNPKLLRENYIKENIFKIGEEVENLNTGLVGKIIRRGTNYLICVTEDDIMFKSWIKDVTEAYTEKSMTSIKRGPNKPNTLIGTDGYLKYVKYINDSPKRKKINKSKEKTK